VRRSVGKMDMVASWVYDHVKHVRKVTCTHMSMRCLFLPGDDGGREERGQAWEKVFMGKVT
jgi:hypothetical protein